MADNYAEFVKDFIKSQFPKRENVPTWAREALQSAGIKV